MKFKTTNSSVLRPWAVNAKSINPNFVRAQNDTLFDKNSREYYDLTSMWFNVSLGHNNKKIILAIKQQYENIDYMRPDFDYNVVKKCCDKIKNLLPSKFSGVFATPGGAEAVEAAVKFAMFASKRNKIMCFEKSFHGTSIFTQNMGTTNYFGYNNNKIINIPRPNSNSAAYEKSLFQISKLLKEMNIAALVLEPITSLSGVEVPPSWYMQEIAELCRKTGTYLIFDEILVGLMRTGKMFGFEHIGVVPDIICLGKTITSGYFPMGATVVTDDIVKYLKSHPLGHCHTYSWHPVGCAAAIEIISQLKETKLRENIKKINYTINNRLKSEQTASGVGSLWSIKSLSIKANEEEQLMKELLDLGVLAYYDSDSRNIFVSPPFTTKVSSLRKALDSVLDSSYFS